MFACSGSALTDSMETPARTAATTADFTVDNVEKALHQLYYDPNIENKNLAQKWLMQAQISPQAWQFCWALLSPDKVPEIQYFGASALHTKISRYWSDIPAEQYDTLKTQLFSQIALFASGSKIVLTRLCVALASLALNTMPEAWPGAISEMVRVFQEEGSTVDGRARCLALLELLTVLPEEFQTSRLPQYRRGQVRGALGREWAFVYPLLQQLLRQADSPAPVKARALKCLSSWALLDVPLSESEGLLEASFAALNDPELFDAAVEAIVNAISQPDSQRYLNTLLKLVPQVLQLQEQLREAVQNGDMETSHGICRIAVSLGENHSRALLEQVEHWQSFLALVNMIMFCTGIPGHYPVNETTSSLTLTFWYTLQTSQCMWLMQALGFLLSALPVTDILHNLHSLITPYIQQLEKLAHETPNPSNKLAIIHILGLLSNLFTTLDITKQEEESGEGAPPVKSSPPQTGPNPVVVVLQQVFALIHTVLSKWLNDSQVVEAVCAIFEKSVKTLLHDFAPMVSQLSEMLGQMYSTIPQASALDLTRQMMHIFASESDHFPPIKALFELVTSVTLTIFQQGPRDHPDIVDSFMQLQAQALKRKPDLFLSENLDVKAVFHCGILSLKFPEAPTVKSTCLFFTELLPHCADVSPVGQVVQEDGKLLLLAVLEAIGGQSSRSLMDQFAEVLFSMNKHCFSLLTVWLKEALQSPGFPSSRVSDEQKDTFSQQVLRERVNKRRVKDIVKEFTLVCRGLHGTEYAAEY
ncbi:importin-13 isoform X1 [Tachysurus ichikawai]